MRDDSPGRGRPGLIVRWRSTLLVGVNLALGVGALAWMADRYGAAALRVLAITPAWGRLLAAVACSLAAFALSVWRWRSILRRAGVPVGVGSLVGSRAAGAAVSSILPSGKLLGEPVRILLAARAGVPVAAGLATVTLDRMLEFAASAPFACVYTAALVGAGIHEANRMLASVVVGSVGLAIGVWVAVRRMRLGRGMVSAFARAVRLDRSALVRERLGTIDAAEALVVELVTPRQRVLGWFGLGVLANVANFAEYQCLLAAFGLPAAPFYVMAAIVAAELSRTSPMPAAVGALEAGQVWLFTMLGFSPDVGLAVGFVLRVREMLWLLPGVAYALAHGGFVDRRD